VFCGQGADELFGGYAKYEKLLQKSEDNIVLALMDSDLHNLQTVTIPLLKKIVSPFGLQLITPFIDQQIIDFSSSLPFSCKLHQSRDVIVRKRVLRLLAKNLDLPSQIVNAPKRAMQYGSGAHRTLTKLATEYWNDQDPELTKREAKTHARIEQYLSQLVAKTTNS
jgi:asparagine synthase (glutamine-hydrolysing)